MTPTVQGETLVYLQDEQERELTVGTSAWFAWLETASMFSFVSEEGLFTARHERAKALNVLSPIQQAFSVFLWYVSIVGRCKNAR
jgi:hypothetical protein